MYTPIKRNLLSTGTTCWRRVRKHQSFAARREQGVRGGSGGNGYCGHGWHSSGSVSHFVTISPSMNEERDKELCQVLAIGQYQHQSADDGVSYGPRAGRQNGNDAHCIMTFLVGGFFPNLSETRILTLAQILTACKRSQCSSG